ncbi:DUF1911 domain-containing protein [Entomomonas sp. E2T0]|uniref:DUF1911 domain-containing protein n=1 Tax=Entomomonas sp. E2T0 TaxID=2930213 RepID=UPI00222817ED|nr:DUF1911 domain-containing protein [Entomomonas sp. E2T0]UYZ82735.1 DUF1911 domain-containing protein [Entomomonas sp. E2T0]
MSEFEQQRRQKLLDEDFYHYFQKILNWEISEYDKHMKTTKEPFTEPMVFLQYEQLCLDYTAGKSISELPPLMVSIVELTTEAIDFVVRHSSVKNNEFVTQLNSFSKYFESEFLSNLLGLCILFDRQDWFETIVKATDLDQENREKAIDSLIAMKIPNYPITEANTPRGLSFRNPLYKAIHAETPKETLKYLDEYLCRWYDGLRKAGYEYIDIHLSQQEDSRDYCSFYGYWCFEAAAVAYLKNIDDSSLQHFMYYPKDMVAYARNKQ